MYKIISPLRLNGDLERLAAELDGIKFDGVVDFVNYPVFSYDIKNFVRVDQASDPETLKILENMYKVIEDDKVINYSGEFKTLQCGRIKLGKTSLGGDYHIQEFFNDFSDAKCVVFNISESGRSIYHDSYTIRVVVIDRNGEVVKFDEGEEK